MQRGPARERRATCGAGVLALTAVACAVLTAANAQTPPPASALPAEAARQILDQFCVTCHRADAKNAATETGVVLDVANVSSVAFAPAL